MTYEELIKAVVEMLMLKLDVTPTTLQKRYFPHIKNRQLIAYYLKKFKKEYKSDSLHVPSREKVYTILDSHKGRVTVTELMQVTGLSQSSIEHYRADWNSRMKKFYDWI